MKAFSLKKHAYLGLMLILFSPELYAGCPKPSGGNHLVITMEGLGGRLLGSRAARLANSVRSGAGFDLASYSHTDSNQTMIKCIKKWKARAGAGFRLSVIGHSFGGRDAIKLAEALSGTGLKINDLIILDGREGSDTGSACRGNMSRPYPRPPNVGKVTNFYGCSSMLNGRLIAGAENHYVSSSHIGIPNTAYVRAKVGYILRGSGVGANTHKDALNILGHAARRQRRRLERQERVAGVRRRTGIKIVGYRCERSNGLIYECSKAEREAQNIEYKRSRNIH